MIALVMTTLVVLAVFGFLVLVLMIGVTVCYALLCLIKYAWLVALFWWDGR